MMVRIRFCKYGVLKFIGHLDTMRFFQKAIRRAGLDVVYSQGFSPHQIMSFASPLGVGITSDAEYLDVELHTCGEPEEMMAQLNAVMVEGIEVTGVKVLPEPLPNQRRETAMSLVAAADYLVSFKDGYDFAMDREPFEKAFAAFLASASIPVMKKSKKTEREMDIRPWIYAYAFPGAEAYPESHAERYENGIRVFLQLSAGSSVNIKPELVIEAFCESTGLEYNEFAWQIHRLEVYQDTALSGLTRMQIDECVRTQTLPERKLVGLIG